LTSRWAGTTTIDGCNWRGRLTIGPSRMRRMELRRPRHALPVWIVLVVGLLGGVATSPEAAHAGKAGKGGSGKVERTFGGKILVSDKKFPQAASSEAAYISKLKKQVKSRFQEDRSKQEWKVHFAAFFKKPLGDLEYTIRLFDVTSGQRLVSSFEQYTDSGDQRSLISWVVLDRKQFGVNKKILMTIESKGRVMAAGQFHILGEPERFRPTSPRRRRRAATRNDRVNLGIAPRRGLIPAGGVR
jgi:hypothetical protein